MSGKTFDAVFWDFDGVILRSSDVWFAASMAELVVRNLQIDEADVAQHIAPHLREAEKYGVKDINTFIDAVVARALPNLIQAAMDQEIWKIICELNELGIPQVIISNSTLGAIEGAFAHHGIKTLPVQAVYTPDERGLKRKPNPVMLHLAAKELGVDIAQALMIGDSETDILAAKAAGAQSALLHLEHHVKFVKLDSLMAHQPDHVLRDMLAVKALLGLTN